MKTYQAQSLLMSIFVLFSISANAEYKIQNNGTEVFDANTGLVWQRCAVGQKWNGSTCNGKAVTMNYFQLKLALENSSRLGGWRVPTIQELSTLIDCNSGVKRVELVDVGNPEPIKNHCHGNYKYPTIKTDLFPNTPERNFWSSTPARDSGWVSGSMWGVSFVSGVESNGFLREDSNYLRLVK